MRSLTNADLLKLKRWNTPTVYNGWEQITKHDVTKGSFNLEEVHDFMPQMGVMAGYAVTVVIEPSKIEHKIDNPDNWNQYRRYVASVPGPKIVVVKDLDHNNVGSFWGEVNSNFHRSVGCVGTITYGAIRDVDEMVNAGFKALAKRLCVGHAHIMPLEWGCDVDVFGCPVKSGQLIHADKHGFLAIPEEDEQNLIDMVDFMDNNECATVIEAVNNTAGKTTNEIVSGFERARKMFNEAIKLKKHT